MSFRGTREQGRIAASSPANALADDIISAIQEITLRWGRENYRDFPWRNPEKLWHALIAEILLQRTRAANVVPVYLTFLEQFSTPRSLAEAPVDEIERIIYPLGLRWRARLLNQLGIRLSETGGELPRSMEQLLDLPGVGRYVASAWLSLHGGARSIIIDANVVRWLCRLVGQEMDGETRREKWVYDLADTLTPDSGWRDYNYAVLDFTMEICTSSPRCASCPIGPNLCEFGRKRLSWSGK